MQTRGLIFIPDISGFSSFVKQIEIEHSRLIIQELLEILLDANESELVVSEIEGDAILFYKFGDKPQLGEVYKQVEKMFLAFHKSLLAYERRKYCHCNACLSAIKLSLKVITHYGEFTEYNVKSFNKLIGKDIIVAHQLLKNDIDQHEYWLVTDELSTADNLPRLSGPLAWNDSIKDTEEGSIHFHYVQLGHLKNDISIDPAPQPDLSQMRKLVSLTRDYETDLITLFHASGDFTYRQRWMAGVKKVEIENHFLPRLGMRCRLIMEDGVMTVSSNHYIFQDPNVEFSEKDEATGDITNYKLERIGENRARLTMEYYTRKNSLKGLLYAIGAGSKKAFLAQSMQNLGELVKQMGDSVRKKSGPVTN